MHGIGDERRGVRSDREKASDDYHYYLDEYCYAEDLGFDLPALNEHHGNPICMGSVMNVEASDRIARRRPTTTTTILTSIATPRISASTSPRSTSIMAIPYAWDR